MSENDANLPAPRPIPTVYSRFFWEGARRGKLLIQRCASCGRYAHPPGPVCPRCGSAQLAPEEVSGRGRVHSYCVVRHTFHPAFRNQLPYFVARVELDEQPNLFLITNLRNCTRAEARVSLPVRVLFETVAEDVLPQFEPADPSERSQ